MQKKTLPNLKYLLDELIKDFFAITQHPQFMRATPTTPGYSKPIDTYFNSTTDYGRRADLNRISSQSSTTTGLSLTPPTPSPGIAVDHENFHNMALPVGVAKPVSGAARQPVANGAEGRARDDVGGVRAVVGVAMETGSVVVENGGITRQDGSLEDGFGVGMFRSRSSHVTGDYPSERGVRRGSSGGSSSHEQLHYGASVEAEIGDLSQIGNGTEDRASQELPRTPPSFPNQQLERYILEQNTAREQQQQQQQEEQYQQHRDRHHDLIHFEQSHGGLRETSPAGAGLFAPSDSEEPVGVEGGMGGATQESGSHANDGVESWKVWNTEEIEGTKAGSSNSKLNQYTSNIDRELGSNGVPSRRTGMSQKFSHESSLDFPQVTRSSKLVNASDIQPRRDRAESREHNMPPSPGDEFSETPSGSIFFTASGFSRLSPSENEIRASTPTDHSGDQIPQVLVERPFSTPERDGSSITAGDLANSSDWSSGALVCSNDASRSSRSPADETGPPSHPPPSSQMVVGESESQPMVPLFSKGKIKEVELADISTFPLSPHSQGEQLTTEVKPVLTTTSTSTLPGTTPYSQRDQEPNPTSDVNVLRLSAVPASYSQKEQVANSALAGMDIRNASIPSPSTPPNNFMPSSEGLPYPPPSPPTDSSHPRAQHSYTTFPQSPQLYKSSLATPHVLGGHQEAESTPSQVRVRENSSRMQRPLLKVVGYNHQSATPTSSRSRSHSAEGSTEFLEDFIDGF